MTTSPLIPNPPKVIAPPFTLQTAMQKVRLAEDAWNSRDPDRVSLAYTEDSVWRNRSEFLVGRDQIRSFLARKWAVILIGRDIFKPAVALQILDALPPGFQNQKNLVVAQILKLAIVFGCLHDDFVGAHRLHLIVDSVGPALGITFHAKERVRVR